MENFIFLGSEKSVVYMASQGSKDHNDQVHFPISSNLVQRENKFLTGLH